MLQCAKDIQRSELSAFDIGAAGALALDEFVKPLKATATKSEKQLHQAQIDLVP